MKTLNALVGSLSLCATAVANPQPSGWDQIDAIIASHMAMPMMESATVNIVILVKIEYDAEDDTYYPYAGGEFLKSQEALAGVDKNDSDVYWMEVEMDYADPVSNNDTPAEQGGCWVDAYDEATLCALGPDNFDRGVGSFRQTVPEDTTFPIEPFWWLIPVSDDGGTGDWLIKHWFVTPTGFANHGKKVIRDADPYSGCTLIDTECNWQSQLYQGANQHFN